MVALSEPISRSPVRLSSAVALCFATTVVLVLALDSILAATVGALGVLLAALGLVRGSRRLLGVAVAALVVGLLAAGMAGASPESSVLAMAATVLVWDVGENAINVGEQLGREADTRRLQLAHVGGGTAFVASVAGVAAAIYAVATGGQPAAAIVLLLVGAILLVSTLRD